MALHALTSAPSRIKDLLVEHAERLGARLASHDAPALGLIETSSIAKGYEVADAVVKQSPVRLLWARTTSPGKFVTLLGLVIGTQFQDL